MNDIFDLLLKYKEIGKDSARLVRSYCEKWKVTGFLGLLETHLFTETELADILAHCLKMDRIYSVMLPHEEEREFLIPYEKASLEECLVLPSFRDKKAHEAILSDPTDRRKIAELRALGVSIFSVGERTEIKKAIQDYYPLGEQFGGIG
jgi:hypothetical protein